jgi:ribonuclease P protein component
VSVDAPNPGSEQSRADQSRADQPRVKHSRAEQHGGDQYGQRRPVPSVSLGFPRTARLLKHSDFERVYKQGRRHFSPHMTVFYLANSAGQLRVGFTVGRALGGAVERNRIKRRLREAVRLRRSTIQQPLDIVINPKKSVLTLEFVVVLEEIGRAFNAIDSAAKKKADGAPRSRSAAGSEAAGSQAETK